MRESELLKRIFSRSAVLGESFPQVLVGPGDDCAVLGMPGTGKGRPGPSLLLKVDQLIEGRHYTPRTPMDLIARKAIARAVSDIAAMAGTPIAALAGAALPSNYPQNHANALYESLLRWSMEFGCPLIGGDTATLASPGPLTLSITIVGTPHATRGPVLRSTARVGDNVFVTGAIGGSFRAQPGPGFDFAGGGKHLTFQPRLREAQWLADTLGAGLHSMMDISDGLGLDAGRLAERSGVAIELDGPRIPLSAGERDMLRAVGQGEDYELLFTSPPDAALPPAVPGSGTTITQVGRVVAKADTEESTCVILHNGDRVRADQLGWEHS